MDRRPPQINNPYQFGDFRNVLETIHPTHQLNPSQSEVIVHAIHADRADVVSLLLRTGLDVNWCIDYNYTSLLHAAVDCGSTAVVDLLIISKADVNARTADLHYTPLHLAVKSGRADIAEKLIVAGSYVHAYGSNGYAPLHLATLEGHVECLRVLLNTGIDVNMPSGHGNSALHIAIMESRYEATELLLEYKADVDAKNDAGWCPLHGAAEAGNVQLVECLLNHNANINALTTFVLYRTPLMLAANSGLSAVVKSLLEHGAKTDMTTQYGETAVHLAVLGRHLPVVKLLIEHKANLDVTTHLGLTPIHFAAKAQDVSIVSLLLDSGAKLDSYEKSQLCLGLAVDSADLALVSLCIRQGASPNISLSACGQTALHRAVRRGSKDIVQTLLELGADPNAMTEDCGESPLHVAAYGEGENEDLMRLLIRHGADVDAIFQQCNWTALTIVMENGHEGCTRLLLDNGADVRGLTDDGETAIHIAAREGFTEGVNLLLAQDDECHTLTTRDREGDLPHHKTVYGDHQMALHVMLLHGCPLNVEDGSGETALEHAVTARSFGCSALLLLHGAVYDDVLLDYVLTLETEAMITMYTILVNSGNSADNPFAILFCDPACLEPSQHAFRIRIRETVRKNISLKTLTRMAIRNHLIDIHNKSIVPAIKVLPLPKVIKEHLLLKELSEYLETEVSHSVFSL